MKKIKILIVIILISVTLFSYLSLKGNKTKHLKSFIRQAEEMTYTTTDGDYEYDILTDGTVEIPNYRYLYNKNTTRNNIKQI